MVRHVPEIDEVRRFRAVLDLPWGQTSSKCGREMHTIDDVHTQRSGTSSNWGTHGTIRRTRLRVAAWVGTRPGAGCPTRLAPTRLGPDEAWPRRG
jgi:hypothetical protein